MQAYCNDYLVSLVRPAQGAPNCQVDGVPGRDYVTSASQLTGFNHIEHPGGASVVDCIAHGLRHGVCTREVTRRKLPDQQLCGRDGFSLS